MTCISVIVYLPGREAVGYCEGMDGCLKISMEGSRLRVIFDGFREELFEEMPWWVTKTKVKP